MAHWAIKYRAKKSPYVVGLQKRKGIKITSKPNSIVLSGNDLVTRQDALRQFKKLYDWAIVMQLTKIKKGR